MSQLDSQNGYSASVEGILKAQGQTYELAKIGLDSCVLQEPATVPEGDAEIVVKVDEKSRSQYVKVLATRSGTQKVVKFTRSRIRILFVGASPLETGYSDIGYGPEYRAIEAGKKKGVVSDQFELFHCLAATPDKLLESLTLYQPHILHFACHGTLANQLVLESKQRAPHDVHLSALKKVVAAQQQLRLVVFNACLSDRQAASLVDDIDAAIGMNDEITERSAIIFARELYHRIFCGFDLQNSYESAVGALALFNTGQDSLPVIHCRNGVNTETIVFARQTSSADEFLGGLSYEQIVDRITNRHDMLTDWPRTVGSAKWIDRPELEQIKSTVSDETQSTILLLGAKGTGKSALLSELAAQLKKTDATVITLKAEFLPSAVSMPEDLGMELLGKCCDPVQLIQYIATKRKVVFIVDQLDAVAELMDRETNRLNVLLNVFKQLEHCPNVHVVASCREFEYRHDVRLSTLKSEELRLQLPSWDDVATVLLGEDFSTATMSAQLQELLRTPWHLKMFLSVAGKESNYESLHNLIQAVWDKSVLNAEGPDGREALTRELSKRICNEEELWVDSSFCNQWPEARDYLIAADILIPEKQRKVIGFRHQTYYDYVLATTFAAGGESLVEHVRGKEQSLFVRPTLLSALNWLRDVQPKYYQEQLRQLFESNPRPHIRTLLIEFVGNQENPNEIEADLLLPLLEDEKDGRQVLASAAFSSGWFNRLILDQRFTEWLKKDTDDAVWCIRVLQTGIREDARKVLSVLRQYWFTDPSKDNLTAAVLRELNEWDLPTARMVATIAGRSEVHGIGTITNDISKQHPELVPAMIRAAIEFKSRNVDNATFGKTIDILVKACDFYELNGLAQGVPEEFLTELMPWFEEYVSANREPGSNLITLLSDVVSQLRFHHQLPDDELCVALCIASEQLASKSPAQFSRIVERYSTSEMMASHIVLMSGLLKLCESNPSIVLQYLLGDDRRLMVERGINAFGFSSQLISEVFPYLNSSQRAQLEKKLREYKSYPDEFLKAEPAKNRRMFLRWNREYRLRLLNSIPDDCISLEMAKLRDDERLQLQESVTERRYWEGGMIGSRMTVEEILKAKPADLLNLINRLTQTEQETGRHFDTRFDARRAGGLGELCRAVQDAVSQEPTKGLQLFECLQPEKHDLAAAAVIRGLSASSLETNAFYVQIVELINKGFDGLEFREAAASAVASRASPEYPPPQTLLDHFYNWCLATPSESRENSKGDAPEDAVLFYRYSPTMVLTARRGAIIRSYVQCYAAEEPRRPELLSNLLEQLIKQDNNPEVIAEVIYYFRDLFSVDKQLATDLYDRAIKSCPPALKCSFCAYAIASLINLICPQDRIFDWLQLLKNDGGDLASQIYGELLFLLYQSTSDERCESMIRQELSLGVTRVVIGLGFGAGYFWNQPHCRLLATDILVQIARQDDGTNNKIIEHCLRFSDDEGFTIDQNSRSFIQTVLDNPVLLHEFVDPLAEIIEDFVSPLPEFALAAISSIVGEIESNPERRYQIAPEAVTNVAITLHRKPSTRATGLELFERILELNLVATRAAIELLDRKPGLRLAYFRQHRERRRRRRSTKQLK